MRMVVVRERANPGSERPSSTVAKESVGRKKDRKAAEDKEQMFRRKPGANQPWPNFLADSAVYLNYILQE
jgi:hypothetical protein